MKNKDKLKDEFECSEPCDPVDSCDNCVEYWNRMEREGFWDVNQHKWTEKGWNQITKSF